MQCKRVNGAGVHSYFGQLFDLVGVEVELLQGLLKVEDLFGDLLQAAVRVVQRGDGLLLSPQAAAWHQPHKQTPLAAHPHDSSGTREEKENKISISSTLIIQGNEHWDT